MADRGKRGAFLVLLGGVLVGVSCFEDMYAGAFKGAPGLRDVTSLWGMKTGVPGYPDPDVVAMAGVPVVFAAAMMVVAVALTLLGEKVARVARVVTLVAAGLLVGTVLLFVVEAIRQKQVNNFLNPPEQRYLMTYLPGLYLLVAGAVAGLVGAVLVQREGPVEEEEEPDEVVVHQFMDDDDTPPFGIAMPLEAKGD